MATGVVPFRGETAGVIFESILNRLPASPVRVNPDIPPEMERIIHKSLEKDCDVRYQHAADLLADLKRLKRETDSASTVHAHSSAEKGKPKVSKLWIASGCLAVILLV